MKQYRVCKYCGENLGNLHQNKVASVMFQHFKEKHLIELEEMKKARRELDYLKEKYGFQFTYADHYLKL